MNQMITTQQTGAINAGMVYDRVDPMQFIDEMGKQFMQAGICTKEAEGKVLALACLCERKNPFEIKRRFHIISGNMSMRSDVQLAEFRMAGGKHRWIDDGTKGGSDAKATIELTFEGQTIQSSYSMADMRQAQLFKSGGGWDKNPANMLRARATSNGIKMLAPEISAGLYTPEEIEDFGANSRPEETAAPPTRTAAETSARGEQLRRMNEEALKGTKDPGPAPRTVAPVEDTVIDVEATPANTSTAPVEDAPFSTADDPASGHATITPLFQITTICAALGMKVEELESQLRGAMPNFTKLEDLSEAAANKLLENLQKKLNAQS